MQLGLPVSRDLERAGEWTSAFVAWPSTYSLRTRIWQIAEWAEEQIWDKSFVIVAQPVDRRYEEDVWVPTVMVQEIMEWRG